jgi:hypothetical protein
MSELKFLIFVLLVAVVLSMSGCCSLTGCNIFGPGPSPGSPGYDDPTITPSVNDDIEPGDQPITVSPAADPSIRPVVDNTLLGNWSYRQDADPSDIDPKYTRYVIQMDFYPNNFYTYVIAQQRPDGIIEMVVCTGNYSAHDGTLQFWNTIDVNYTDFYGQIYRKGTLKNSASTYVLSADKKTLEIEGGLFGKGMTLEKELQVPQGSNGGDSSPYTLDKNYIVGFWQYENYIAKQNPYSGYYTRPDTFHYRYWFYDNGSYTGTKTSTGDFKDKIIVEWGHYRVSGTTVQLFDRNYYTQVPGNAKILTEGRYVDNALHVRIIDLNHAEMTESITDNSGTFNIKEIYTRTRVM